MQSKGFEKYKVTKEQYNRALSSVEKQAFIICKQKPRDDNI